MLRAAIRQIRKNPCNETLFLFLDMVRYDSSCKLAAVKAGVIDTMVSAISKQGIYQHDHAELANTIFYVIRELSLDVEVGKKLYTDCQLMDFLLDVLSKEEDSRIIEHILATFSNIVLTSKLSLLSFIGGDIIELIVNTAVDFTNDPIVQAEVCELFDRLAHVDPCAKDYLGRKGAVNIAVQALELYGTRNEKTRQKAIKLLTYMVTDHVNNTYIAMQLNAHEVIGKLIENECKKTAAKLGMAIVLIEFVRQNLAAKA